MKEGAPVGAVKTVWFAGTDNLALERLQPVCSLGAAKAGTTRKEIMEIANIVIRRDLR
jgi:hypothetical protein